MEENQQLNTNNEKLLIYAYSIYPFSSILPQK